MLSSYKLLYVKHEKNSDIFRKTNAWSLYYHIVENVSYITIYTESHVYKITSENAKEKGDFL